MKIYAINDSSNATRNAQSTTCRTASQVYCKYYSSTSKSMVRIALYDAVYKNHVTFSPLQRRSEALRARVPSRPDKLTNNRHCWYLIHLLLVTLILNARSLMIFHEGSGQRRMQKLWDCHFLLRRVFTIIFIVSCCPSASMHNIFIKVVFGKHRNFNGSLNRPTSHARK